MREGEDLPWFVGLPRGAFLGLDREDRDRDGEEKKMIKIRDKYSFATKVFRTIYFA
jgi:hypothetical protein